jgi:hypothetical protein
MKQQRVPKGHFATVPDYLYVSAVMNARSAIRLAI